SYNNAAPIESEELDQIARPTARAKSYGSAGGYLDREQIAKEVKTLQQVDPNAALQTGPGIPSWQWRTWSLTWSGPVEKDENVQLYLLSPMINLALALLRAALAIGLLLIFLRLLRHRIGRASAAAALIVCILAGTASREAAAQSFPSDELLGELEQRIHR